MRRPRRLREARRKSPIVPYERLPGGTAHRAALDRLRDVILPDRIVPGYATVELDRAEKELADAAGSSHGHSSADLGDDAALGARCRLLTFADGSEIVLLEPATEGRLAAALARFGEAVAALYLIADRAAVLKLEHVGFRLGTELVGPFGPQRLVVDGRRDSALIVVAPSVPAS